MTAARGAAASPAGRVRRAGARDLDRLAALFAGLVAHHRPLGPAWDARSDAEVARAARDWLRAELRDPDARVLCLDADGDLLAFLVARVARRPPIFRETTRGSVDHLVVRPDARRRGLGRALVAEAAAWLRGQGATRLEVAVARGNAEGAGFWRALGFEPAMDVLDRPL
ncbi:MAG: GNAT family N-acetyltransferase [Myxococcota bacterium]|nr:GNAT family N-acetyltransferase [Myxococcota bacterium]